MNTEYKEFIGIYRDLYPENYCRHLMEEFENLTKFGAGYNRQQSDKSPKHEKDDLQISLNMGVHALKDFDNQRTIDMFFKGLQHCYDHYTEKFSILKSAKISSHSMKMQRTDPGGGYHLWHAEQFDKTHCERVLVFMLYLNTLNEDEGGETEFLYQRLRLKPEENTMIIWPAAYTHTHRGNTVLGNQSKYIVTGWFYFE